MPGPSSIHLHLKRPAEEGADEHDQPEHANGRKGGIDSHAANDVGSHQKFQPNQDGLSQVSAEVAIGRRRISSTGGFQAWLGLASRQRRRDGQALDHETKGDRGQTGPHPGQEGTLVRQVIAGLLAQ